MKDEPPEMLYDNLISPTTEENASEDLSEQGLVRVPGFFGGVCDDYRRRLPHILADFRDGVSLKTVSAALFMFFATFFSTVALGVIVQKASKNRIGIEEYLIMNSVAGMTHALLGCQPLLVLRPTGPITAILLKLCVLADALQLDFWQYLGATGMFVGLYMILVAGLEMSRWIKHLTRFTHEIFAFFVCSIYIHDGVADVVDRFRSRNRAVFGESFFAAFLACLTFAVANWLHAAPLWRTFTHGIRTRIFQDYALTIAVLVTIGVAHIWPLERVEYIFSSMPDTLGPSYPGNAASGSHHLVTNHTGGDKSRAWLVDFSGADPILWVYAALTGLPIVFFFYMDQNVSSLLTQLPHMRLDKGHYFHSSFLWMGFFNVLGPMLGLPFVTGSLPHSPQLVAALTNRNEQHKIVNVEENRIAPFLCYALIGLPVLMPQLLEPIPEAAIAGILVFVGVAGLYECELWTRLICLLRIQAQFPEKFRSIDAGRMHFFTGIQILLLAICWAVNLSPVGLLFSLCVVSIIPFRNFVMPRLFDKAELEALDSDSGILIGDAAAAPRSPVNGARGQHGSEARSRSLSYASHSSADTPFGAYGWDGSAGRGSAISDV